MFDGYVSGLRDADCPAATDVVRTALAAAAALRFLGFFTRCRPLLVDNPDAITAIVGHPVEEVFEHLVKLAGHMGPIAAESVRFVNR